MANIMATEVTPDNQAAANRRYVTSRGTCGGGAKPPPPNGALSFPRRKSCRGVRGRRMVSERAGVGGLPRAVTISATWLCYSWYRPRPLGASAAVGGTCSPSGRKAC